MLCFHFPEVLTTPEVREAVPLPVLRSLLHLVLVLALVFGLISAVLRKRKVLGGIGIGLGTVAVLLGGSTIAERTVGQTAAGCAGPTGEGGGSGSRSRSSRSARQGTGPVRGAGLPARRV